MKKLPIVLVALLALPSAAHASGPDAGQQFCGTIRDQASPPAAGCVTIAEADEYKGQHASGPYSGYVNPATGAIDSTPSGAGCGGSPPTVPYTCVTTNWYFVNRQYGVKHRYSTLTWRNVLITWKSVDGVGVLPANLQNTSVTDDSRLNAPECPILYEGVYGGGHPELRGNAALLLEQCGITQTPTGETPTNETPTTTTAPLRRCAAFKNGRKRVAVTSRGVACRPARNLLARFVRRGVEPTGYVCVKVRLGRMVAAKCKKTTTSRARALPIVVEGRWRA